MAAKKSSKSRQKTKDKKKKRLYYIGGAAAFVLLLVWWGTQPLRGSMHVGVCRTFAELHIAYPHTMRLTWAERFDRSQRLYFLHIDGFGRDQVGFIDCRFKEAFASSNYELQKVEINRKPISEEVVKRFNLTIPAIVAAQPNLIIPHKPAGDLRSLRLEIE